jgi:hypothetical protein
MSIQKKKDRDIFQDTTRTRNDHFDMRIEKLVFYFWDFIAKIVYGKVICLVFVFDYDRLRDRDRDRDRDLYKINES